MKLLKKASRRSPLHVAVEALKNIQYKYSGAGRSYEDLCAIKTYAECALSELGMFEMSLDEFKQRSGK